MPRRISSAHPETTERNLPVSADQSEADAAINQFVNRWGWMKDREMMRAELMQLLTVVMAEYLP